MVQKRKVQEAFGAPKGQLSAFAAAKLARQTNISTPPPPPVQLEQDAILDEDLSVLVAAQEPYEPVSSPASSSSVEDVAETADVEAVPLATFRPDASNSTWLDASTLELRLDLDETATILGEYEVSVSTGIISIYGTVLRAEVPARRVFAPSSHALPQIQARQNGTIIRITSVDSGLRKLDRCSPLFRNIWASDASMESSFAVLGSSTDDTLQRSLNVLSIDRDTDGFLRVLSAKTAAETRKPRILVVGAKASGKSTLNRVICNHILNWTSAKVCQYLDIDPGQPEFGTPGQLSLVEVSQPMLGPPFTHPASSLSSSYRIVRSHSIAATSFKEDPDHYKACVADLAQRVDPRYPLIVNSCGWVTGLGANVHANLVATLKISDIGLMEPLDRDFFESLQQTGVTADTHKLPRQPSRPSSRTPAEHRAMQTMAYFHSRLSPNNPTPHWSSKPISRTRPWLVPYTGPNPGIFSILSHNETPPPEFLSELLNGSLVSLTLLSDDPAAALTSQITHTPDSLPYLNSTQPLNPSTSHTLGLALIRAIDPDSHHLHIITPLPASEIAQMAGKKVVLVRGSFDPPDWAYLEDLYYDPVEAAKVERPWASKRSLVGIEGAVWRLRHPPMASAVGTGK